MLVIATTFRTRAGFMYHTHGNRRVTGMFKNLCQVLFVGIQVPPEIRMRQAHDPVIVRITTGK